jgi:hypothetical protein
MRTSEQSHDNWMSLIPLSVLILFVMVEAGGPEAFFNLVTSFTADALALTASWLRHL